MLADVESWPVDVLSVYPRLFELRPRGRAVIGRAFYCFMVGKRITVLHSSIKKTQQTPDRELKLARKRRKELEQRYARAEVQTRPT